MPLQETDQTPISRENPRQDVLSAPAVLIGTRETIPELVSQLGTMAAPPRAVGCILVEEVPESRRRHPVLGSIEDLPSLASNLGLRLGVVSLPASMGPTIRRIRATLASLGMAERFVPPLSELLSRAPVAGPSATSPNIDMEDLIGRTPHGIDRRAVARLLEGKRVLVTGAGGSIGSELVRIVATFHPERIILMERSENALFEIDRQLARRFPGVARAAVLHDVVDADRTLRLLVEHRPHVVFHAAAHKHVPLMEDHPSHAVENNFFGTKSIADASLATGAERFVMISSDKAVNPRSVMGATKRLAEMYVQGLHAQRRSTGGQHGTGHTTAFCMVRFGNVLGSACSVLPIWSGQIAEGGPVTVTDPRMTRYFMTIHEAATLVIQAAAMTRPDAPAAGVFVLDMGEPVRILELAQRLVVASGFEPEIVGPGAPRIEAPAADRAPMEIRVTGIRPGEKLHEELAYAAEQLAPTEHPGVNLWVGDADAVPNQAMLVAELSAVRSTHDRRTVLEAIRRHIPTLVAPADTTARSESEIPNRTNSSSKQSASVGGLAA